MSEAAAWGGRSITLRDWLLALVVATLWLSVIRPGPLSLPYFWDEADVYVPGSLWVSEHGLDVSPGVFPDDYSRGHPPLLYFMAGVAFRLFGPSPAVGHLVVLPFTALALACTYLLGTVIFGRRAGLAAALLLGATPLFMSIGNMLLPELPLTALTVLALLLVAQGRLWGAALCGVAAALIKETGVFISVALVITVLWDAWHNGALRHWKPLAGRLVLASLPVVALCLFFLWQRLSPAGYFIFPHHQNLLWDRPLAWADLATVWPSLVLWHGRWIVVGTAIPCLALLTLAHHRKTSSPSSLTDEATTWRPRPSAMVAGMLSIVMVNALFFTKMFWLERYALPAHPGLLITACGVLLGGVGHDALPRHWQGAPWLAVGMAVVLGLFGLTSPTAPNEEEHTFAYADVIATHQQAFEALEAVSDGGEPLVLTSWPMTVELYNPILGYVTHPIRTIHIDHVAQADNETITAVLAPERSRHAHSLRRYAERFGMRIVGRYQVEQSPGLELYTR